MTGAMVERPAACDDSQFGVGRGAVDTNGGKPVLRSGDSTDGECRRHRVGARDAHLLTRAELAEAPEQRGPGLGVDVCGDDGRADLPGLGPSAYHAARRGSAGTSSVPSAARLSRTIPVVRSPIAGT